MAVCEAADVAAKWWANVLENPDHNTGYIGDAKADAIASAIKSGYRLHASPTKEQVEKFRSALSCSIQYHLEAQGDCYTGVDYHAEGVVHSALKAAGIEDDGMMLLPSKTSMWITESRVSVRHGYGAETKTIFGG